MCATLDRTHRPDDWRRRSIDAGFIAICIHLCFVVRIVLPFDIDVSIHGGGGGDSKNNRRGMPTPRLCHTYHAYRGVGLSFAVADIPSRQYWQGLGDAASSSCTPAPPLSTENGRNNQFSTAGDDVVTHATHIACLQDHATGGIGHHPHPRTCANTSFSASTRSKVRHIYPGREKEKTCHLH